MATFFRRGGKKAVAPHLIDELYYSESGEAPDLTDGAVRLSDEAIAEMMSEIYRETWDKSSLTESLVVKETRNIFREAVSKGVPRSTSRRAAFRERLSKSTDVFSVFRVHTQAQHMAELLVDEEGRRRSFAEWAEEVQPYVNHQNRVWLRTEYDTAMRRAESEADWVRFQEDADLYPCLEWVQTTSANPGADHRPFWGTVLPIDDEFWTEHRPGDRWNCKCSLRQTDKSPTRTPSVDGKRYAPSRGLKSKPGSGEIFSDDHLYFPEECHICPFGGGLHGLWADLTGRKRGNCMKCKKRKEAMVQSADDEKPEVSTLIKELTSLKGKEYTDTLKEITSLKIFTPVDGCANVVTACSKKDADYANLKSTAEIASQYVDMVYILPNPKGVRSMDFIFVKKGIYNAYDLKTISGANSVGNRLEESTGQTKRVLLQMNTKYNPRNLAKEIKTYFEKNAEALEVLIFKGKRKISINRDAALFKDFEKSFVSIWHKAQKKR